MCDAALARRWLAISAAGPSFQEPGIREIQYQARYASAGFTGLKSLFYSLIQLRSALLPERRVALPLTSTIEPATRHLEHSTHRGNPENACLFIHKYILHFRLLAKYFTVALLFPFMFVLSYFTSVA